MKNLSIGLSLLSLLISINCLILFFVEDYSPNYNGFKSGSIVKGKELDTQFLSYFYANNNIDYFFDLRSNSKTAYIKFPKIEKEKKYKVLKYTTIDVSDGLKMEVWRLQNDYENIYVLFDPINSRIFVSEDCSVFGEESCANFKYGTIYKVKKI